MVKIALHFYEYMPIPFAMQPICSPPQRKLGSFKRGEQRHGHGRNHHGCQAMLANCAWILNLSGKTHN